MFEVTVPQATVIAAALVTFGGLLTRSVGGLGFFVKRRVTEAPRKERADYFNSLADLIAKMKSSGVDVGELHQLEAMLRTPAVAGSVAAAKVVEEAADESDEWDPRLDNNYAMKMRASAAYEVAEAKLLQALMDLRLTMGTRESLELNKVQNAWAEYRKQLTLFAAAEFEGGSHAGLAGVLAALAETERRTAEVRAEVQQRRSR